MKSRNRREFIKQSAMVGLGTTLFMSSSNVWGLAANETVNVAIVGTGGRSYAHIEAISLCKNIKLIYGCDVDAIQLEKFLSKSKEKLGYTVKGEKDFRKILDNKDVDAIIIATPEHWHAPMAIMGMQSGKHVYVEKPCSHNPNENELLNKAYKKYNKVCQMGNQQRSSISSNQAIKDIKEGIIGDAYDAKAWYANTRGPIGNGKVIPVPSTLDWELWQGPAPREAYKNNVHPYNWHWFKKWGTGELHNNGTHEIDICRWALGVDLPKKVSSTGGRLHFKGDDWQYYDTQVVSYQFEGNKMLTWEGNSCNGMKLYDRDRGAIIYGTKGSIILDRGGYQLLDLKGKEITYVKEDNKGASVLSTDTTGFDGLTVRHMQNFVNAILNGEKLAAPINDGSISTQLCHLGNISQALGTSLDVDSATGKVIGNDLASALWKREYAPGWEPKV